MRILKKFFTILSVVYLVMFLAIVVFSSFTVVTYTNEYSVIKQFGKVTDIRNNTEGTNGLSFKIPFIQSVTKIPNCTLIYDLPKSDVITSDKKTMVADCFSLWNITDPMLYIKSLNGTRSSAESRIDVNVYNGLKNTISKTPQSEVISGRNGELVSSVMNNIGDGLEAYGINLQAVETKHLDLPDTNKESVYTRMISERNEIAAGYTAQGEEKASKIRNDTNKQTSITISDAKAEAEKIIAEGEAEYMQILSKAYNNKSKAEFYSFVRALDSAKESLNDGDILYLDEDSPLASIFSKIK